MKKINTIIKEEINKFLLNESLTDIVYHFTSLDALVNIVKHNRIYLDFSEKGSEEDFNNKKAYFLSLTRQRDGRLGHSRFLNVRITFDGNLLNQNFEGKPINYWRKNGGINRYMRKLKRNYYNTVKNDFPEELKYQRNTENEDRLFSDMPVINNISKYITRIDIYEQYDNDENEIFSWLLNETKLKDIINIYENENEFNSLNGKNVNNRYIKNGIFNNSYENEVDGTNNYRSLFINIVLYLLNFINNESVNASHYINYLIDKYSKYFIDNGENTYAEINERYNNGQSRLANDSNMLLNYEIMPSLRNMKNKKIIKIATKMLRDEKN